MDELAVQQLWMAGVVAAMVIFGIAAAIGYCRNPQQNTDDKDGDSSL